MKVNSYNEPLQLRQRKLRLCKGKDVRIRDLHVHNKMEVGFEPAGWFCKRCGISETNEMKLKA